MHSGAELRLHGHLKPVIPFIFQHFALESQCHGISTAVLNAVMYMSITQTRTQVYKHLTGKVRQPSEQTVLSTTGSGSFLTETGITHVPQSFEEMLCGYRWVSLLVVKGHSDGLTLYKPQLHTRCSRRSLQFCEGAKCDLHLWGGHAELTKSILGVSTMAKTRSQASGISLCQNLSSRLA